MLVVVQFRIYEGLHESSKQEQLIVPQALLEGPVGSNATNMSRAPFCLGRGRPKDAKARVNHTKILYKSQA
jgi:hypothetical protein